MVLSGSQTIRQFRAIDPAKRQSHSLNDILAGYVRRSNATRSAARLLLMKSRRDGRSDGQPRRR